MWCIWSSPIVYRNFDCKKFIENGDVIIYVDFLKIKFFGVNSFSFKIGSKFISNFQVHQKCHNLIVSINQPQNPGIQKTLIELVILLARPLLKAKFNHSVTWKK